MKIDPTNSNVFKAMTMSERIDYLYALEQIEKSAVRARCALNTVDKLLAGQNGEHAQKIKEQINQARKGIGQIDLAHHRLQDLK